LIAKEDFLLAKTLILGLSLDDLLVDLEFRKKKGRNFAGKNGMFKLLFKNRLLLAIKHLGRKFFPFTNIQQVKKLVWFLLLIKVRKSLKLLSTLLLF